MNNLNIEVNDRIEVISGEKVYKSLIIDIGKDYIKINLPVCDGEYLMLHSGEKIEMNSSFKENGYFNFYSEVISKDKEGNILCYKMKSPFSITKIQRRNNFRVEAVESIEYKIATNIDDEELKKIPYKKGIMINLSAGGLKIKIKENLNLSDLIFVNLNLKLVKLELKCDIIRIENTQNKEILCGLKFRDITQAESEMIIKELFEIMRKQRANG